MSQEIKYWIEHYRAKQLRHVSREQDDRNHHDHLLLGVCSPQSNNDLQQDSLKLRHLVELAPKHASKQFQTHLLLIMSNSRQSEETN